jgi:hypothetical protein
MCSDTETLVPLIAFRREVYESVLGHRQDTLFEVLDAVLTSPGAANLVHLSLAPAFRRRWPSAPDALADGTLDVDAIHSLLRVNLPAPSDGGRPLWVIDGTTWPRPDAKTSPERTYGHRVTAGVPQDGIVAAWEYQWLVMAPEERGSWVLPLDVTRRAPTEGTPTQLAIAQLRRALAKRADDAAAVRPVVMLDSGYDPGQLARAKLPADLVVRLATNRVFSHLPGPYAGRGAPRKHGPVFRLQESQTQGESDQSSTLTDPEYGVVRVDAWLNLHTRSAPDAPFCVVRVQVERLPHRLEPPAPLWLAWIGGQLPQDLTRLWRWYLRRFTVEHAFRFLKQTLGWTTVRPRAPEAADRWSWLLALALWHLWLARPVVADLRLPWEQPLPPERLTPGRVRRAFGGLLARLGTPARAPQPRGKSPGRRQGERPGRRKRYEVVRRVQNRAA